MTDTHNEIPEVRRLRPQPGDVLIIRTSVSLSELKKERMKRQLESHLKAIGHGVRAVILEQCSGIEVMSAEEAASSGI